MTPTLRQHLDTLTKRALLREKKLSAFLALLTRLERRVELERRKRSA